MNVRYFILLAVCLQACNLAKRLPANERLYVGTDVNLSADSTVTKEARDELQVQLKELARPRPNKTLLGYPYKVAMYYLFGEPKTEKGFRAWFRRKFGEAPVLASAKAISSNATIFAGLMENEGYFRSSVTGRLTEQGYKARGVYDVRVPARYTIDSVLFLTNSDLPQRPDTLNENDARDTPRADRQQPTIRRADDAMFAISPRTLLKPGDPYQFDVIKAEQERISTTLKNRGFIYFLPDYVAILADSAVGNHKVRLYVALKPEMPEAAGQPYFIRNVYVYPNYTINNQTGNDTNRTQAYTPSDTTLRRVFIVDSARLYKPRLFNDILSLKPGRRFSSRAQDLTLSRFINVGTFKFVRNRFEPIQQGDSALLDVHYYLTPYPKKSIRGEIAGTSRSNGLVGSELTLSLLNRNLLRRAELLTLNASGGFEIPVAALGRVTTTYRYGVTASLNVPRLMVPFRIRYDQRQSLPKTIISAGFEALNRSKYYTLNSFNASFGYAFRTNQRVEQNFTPFSINYVQLANEGPFLDSLALDPQTSPIWYNIITGEQIILNSLYTVSYSSSPRTATPRTYRVQFGIEPAGNLASLVINNRNSEGSNELLGAPIAQYLKLDLDTRYYWRLSSGMTWASRFLAGVGLPYGNSSRLPLIKQYFSGGSNSLRGFRPRTLGPGTFTRVTDGTGFIFQDGGGDIKLEASTELRPKFNQYLQGALFIDAGNVWLKDPSNAVLYDSASTIFGRNFYKEIAVNGGIGLRVDLSYFLFRLDLGIPFRRPDRPDGQRWVFNEINFRDPVWRRQNLVLNVAIGYPF
ncbi:BamA/TamA family outer membrane protein [Rudanella paleaurantiibacter]|uniref:BamA/TamA family outer membrane protein n=1 Tax=Rudanella paleaurantiibacter TaxID=2614655 RepID=A0A7J5U248_9BACT|nr:BamA/TamA family outer membrane protein [Rudanella paleaurantiibacter]KAB7731718.1 BamA/TamA family outer membrane protein [Rudanella paleaurantiibacter]